MNDCDNARAHVSADHRFGECGWRRDAATGTDLEGVALRDLPEDFR